MARPVVRKLVAFLGGTSAFSTTTRSGRPGHYSNYHYHPPIPTYPSATMAALPLLLSRPIDHRFANNDTGVCRGGRRSSSFSAAAGNGESVGGGGGGGRRADADGRRRYGGGGRGGAGHPGRRRRRTDDGRMTPPSSPPYPGMPGRECHRSCVSIDADVYVVKKEDQRSGKETRGVVTRHLTRTEYHPRGIKVMLADGTVGRVIRFAD